MLTKVEKFGIKGMHFFRVNWSTKKKHMYEWESIVQEKKSINVEIK